MTAHQTDYSPTPNSSSSFIKTMPLGFGFNQKNPQINSKSPNQRPKTLSLSLHKQGITTETTEKEKKKAEDPNMCEAVKNHYQILEEIGRGRFGTITRCFSPIANKFYACKTISKQDLTDPTDRECLENEPKIMAFLSPHPNILEFVNVFENDDFLCMILELCEPISLYDRIISRTFSEPEAFSVTKQLLEAVKHCHLHGVVHRDIKPDNILFDSRNNLKLADFGSAEWFSEGRFVGGIVGTPYYVAPEVLRGTDYDEKVDIWSVGVILYTMLAGFPPFYGESAAEIFEAVLRGNLRFPTRVFRNVSPAAKDLMRKMICKDVSRRLSAEQALRHPWVLSGGETVPMI